MTTDEFNAKLDAKIKEIEKTNKPLEITVRSMMALQSKRIFIEGKNADGGIIGTYKGGEIYVSPSANKGLPNFPLKGKSGIAESKKVFSVKTKKASKTVSAHKTGYFKSYLAFKEVIGRNKLIKTVDLFLTGALHRNWANGKVLDPMATKINQNNYVVRLSGENFAKIEKNYQRAFDLSAQEKKQFLITLNIELLKALK